jgi:hypothetical protein
MTEEEFEFWQKAFLAVLTRTGANDAAYHADNALERWKKMRQQVKLTAPKDGPYR